MYYSPPHSYIYSPGIATTTDDGDGAAVDTNKGLNRAKNDAEKASEKADNARVGGLS